MRARLRASTRVENGRAFSLRSTTTLRPWQWMAVFFGILLGDLVKQERKLRVLEGMLPVCGFCKRIRNGAEWQEMERYITEHSEAEFSHTFCPECGQRHYGAYLS